MGARRKRIYLDYAATTPVDRRVEAAMRPYFRKEFGNPSALYSEGVSAREAVDRARQRIAAFLAAHPDEIVFTGSGTESDNLAIQGVLKYVQGRSLDTVGGGKKPHIITSVIEHPAVREVCRALDRDGVADVTYVGVNEKGIVDPKEVKEALRDETVLVSVMYANNEIGTIQPVREIAKVVRDFKKERGSEYPYLHTDACQAANYLDMNVARLGVDLLTFNASKMYGPKGVGALFVKRGVRIAPIVFGGGQEVGLRSGTENVPAIVGFGEAVRIAEDMKEEESVRLAALRDDFAEALLSHIPGSVLNGDREYRLPNNVHISIPGMDSERIVIELDAHGIAASAQSACKSKDTEGSYVIAALGRAGQAGEGGIRFTLGRRTTRRDLDYTVEAMKKITDKVQYEARLLQQ